MTRSMYFLRSTVITYLFRSYMTAKLKQITSAFQAIPRLQQLSIGNGCELKAPALRVSPISPLRALVTGHRQTLQSDKKHQMQYCVRCFSSGSGGGWGDDRDGHDKLSVKLMDFPKRTMPDIVKSLRNRFFAFLIKAYYDRTFSIDGFLEGASQAASHVSSSIAEGNFDELRGLVVDEAIQEIQNNYADLSYQQRKWLKVASPDLIGKFIYEIGMMFDDDTDQRFVEITVVLHGYHDLEDSGSTLGELYNNVGENPDNFYVCNYRFIREFTKGVEDSWTINKLNHFLPFVPPSQ